MSSKKRRTKKEKIREKEEKKLRDRFELWFQDTPSLLDVKEWLFLAWQAGEQVGEGIGYWEGTRNNVADTSLEIHCD